VLPLPTFIAYMAVQWWAFRNADGGGQFVQRLASVPSERDAERSAWFFNILNYVVRCWPWIITALVALAVLPDLQDPETAYPVLMRRYLPAGILGLVFASLLAAFMSTVSAQVNWGASYLVNDIWRRFVRPTASQRHLIWAGRIGSVLITALAAALSFHLTSIQEAFRLIVLLGTGAGAVLILRWFWWRVNAWAEITALAAGVLVTVTIAEVPTLAALEYGYKSIVTTAIVTVLWIAVMYATPPERPETLDAFYRRARPGGAWGPVRGRTGLAPLQNLRDDILRVAAGVLAIMGINIALGASLLQQWRTAVIATAVAALGVALLLRHRPAEPAARANA
jgi:Na+/proline symporter